MPAKKKTTEKTPVAKKSSWFMSLPLFPKVLVVLTTVSLVIWTVIGIAILALFAFAFSQGAYQSLLNPAGAGPQAQVPQAPTEVDLPGVGRVNVECVQNALSEESIQTLITEESAENLPAQEREAFDACVVAPAESPIESPSN